MSYKYNVGDKVVVTCGKHCNEIGIIEIINENLIESYTIFLDNGEFIFKTENDIKKYERKDWYN